MIKACDLKLPIDRRKGRTSHRKPPATTGSCRPKKTGTPKGYERVGTHGAVRPEDTPAGRLHSHLWDVWEKAPSSMTFRDVIQSAYC